MRYLLILLSFCVFFSCEDYNEDLIPLAGVYEGVILGSPIVFTMSIAVDGNDILIDAPFDGFTLAVVQADIRNEDQDIVEIDFCNDEIYPDVFICGEGFYNFGDIQLDYELDFGNGIEVYTLVASRF